MTTARYFTPSGKSIQAAGIAPDIEALQDQPNDGKEGKISSEATLNNHLAGNGTEVAGSQSYVPPDPANDNALKVAVRFLHSPDARGVSARR